MSLTCWENDTSGESEKQEVFIAALLTISGQQIMNVHSSTHTPHTETHTCMHNTTMPTYHTHASTHTTQITYTQTCTQISHTLGF